MNLISRLQEFDGKSLGEDDDGEACFGKLLPGLNKKELEELQSTIPCSISAPMMDILSLTRGIEPAFESMDFSGLSLRQSFEMKGLMPNGLPIAADGFGNFWVADLTPQSKDWGPIFYVCHDPAVAVCQAKTFEEFIIQVMSFASFEENSLINHVHDICAAQIWRDNPGVVKTEDLMHPGDPDLGLFVQSLKKGYQFVDLRRARIGDGISWGRFGPKTELIRNGSQRLFAYRKEPNFIQKLLGY